MNTKMAVASPSSRFATSIFGYDFFISFKLGSFPVGAQSYASDLSRRLREQDFTVFFSEEEAPPGEELSSTLTKALHSARILVVILNEGALLHSTWVPKEVEEYRRQHLNRPIVVIDIDKAKEKYAAQADTASWLGDEERIWLDETNEAVQNGTVSPAIVKRLAITPNFLRSNLRLRWTRRTIAAALILLTLWAFKERGNAIEERDLALHDRSAALTALSNAERTVSPTRAAKLALAAWPRSSKDRAPKLDVALNALSAAVAAAVGQPRELRTFRGHADAVNSAAFSPDGARVVTASKDKTARLWDAATGKRSRGPARPRRCDHQRRLLAGRRARRHRLARQHRTAVGRRRPASKSPSCAATTMRF